MSDERKNSLWGKFCGFLSLEWNRYNCFVNFLIAVCGAVTAVFSCYAAINANEISKRSFANEEQSAQPIITAFIKDDTLNVMIDKEYRGLNFVEAKPMVTMTEGVVSDQSLTSMKIASFMFQGSGSMLYRSCVTEDESGVIKCCDPDLKEFLGIINEKKKNVETGLGEVSFRNLRMAYLLSVSYNDIYNNRQRQRFIVSQRGRQRSITDSLYNERFAKKDRLTMADTTEASVKMLLEKLNKAENMMNPRNMEL